MFKKLNNIKKILLSGSEKGWNIIKEIIHEDDLNEYFHNFYMPKWEETVDISIKENIEYFKNLLNTDYSIALEGFLNDRIIYRGDNDWVNEILLLSPTERTSNNTRYNLYTTLFSEILPSWDGWPKRNHCVVCTTDIMYAKNYTNYNPNIIFPKNNSMIGICPNNDIWDSFHKSLGEGYGIEQFQNDLQDIASEIGFNKLIQDNFDEFCEYFKKYLKNKDNIKNLKKFVRDKAYYKENIETLHYIIDNGYDLFDTLNDLLEPEYNGFELKSLKTFYTKNYSYREIWFDNEFIVIPYDIMKQVKRLF